MRDFVEASEETSGGRLARWLQPESVIDPSKSQLIFPGVFSASVATFGVTSSASLGAFVPSSPIKTNDRGGKIGLLVLPSFRHNRNIFCFLDDDDDETISETTTTTSTTTNLVSEGLRAGWPAILTLLTRDQYGHLVHVLNLKVIIN